MCPEKDKRPSPEPEHVAASHLVVSGLDFTITHVKQDGYHIEFWFLLLKPYTGVITLCLDVKLNMTDVQ